MSEVFDPDARLVYFDKYWNEVPFRTFITLMEDDDYRIIRQDVVSGVLISTVWMGKVTSRELLSLGMAFAFTLFGVFETAVRLPGARWTPVGQYTSEAEAKAGHDMAMLLARERFGPRMIERGNDG